MKRLFEWIDRQIALPADTDRERGIKAAMVVGQLGGLAGSVGLVGLYLIIGYPLSAIIIGAYTILAGINILLFLRTRHYGFYSLNVIWLVLITPMVNQWVLGGFAASGGAGLWSVFALFAALVGVRLRQAIGWLAALLALVVVSGLLEGSMGSPQVPKSLSTLLSIVNVTGVFTLFFGAMLFFVSRLEGALARADQLLLNILPGPIAKQLKERTMTIADGFDEVTVLFADIVDFTRMSADADPREVVTMLNDIFSDFDTLAEKHGLEKIKTIGDAYMVAGGLPVERPDHDVAVVEFALDMLKGLDARRAWNDQPIRVRIGINTGPVVAGVIGRHKFIYDLWGDAVNTASRMESHGLGNAIQVTESTYQRLRDRYEFEARGVVNVKGKGDMNTYLLRGRKAGATA